MSINEFQAIHLIELALNFKPIWRSARQFMYIDCTPNILSRANTFYSFTSNSNAHINVLLYFSISIVLRLCIVAQVKQISFIFQKHACHMPLHWQWMHWHCVMGIISGFRCFADRLWTDYRIYILFFAKDTASLRRA